MKIFKLTDGTIDILYDRWKEELTWWLEHFPDDIRPGLRVEEVEVTPEQAVELCEPMVCKEGKEMKTYRIMNRVTKKWWQGEARDAAEACYMAGWPITDCWVRERTPKYGWAKVKINEYQKKREELKNEKNN